MGKDCLECRLSALIYVLPFAGLDIRYILDVTDHIWAEYYSDSLQRWVHLDPCEAAYDTPHLYEVQPSSTV